MCEMLKKKSFLHHVAQDLISRFGMDMSNVCVVFPNKRARLFLNEELLSLATSPLWAPHYSSIQELFETLSGGVVNEQIPTLCTLYNIYSSLIGSEAESIDRFWGWGEILLSDFDDIDKHLVDADKLFLNAKQLSEMESLDFLTSNQREALTQFFGNMAAGNKTYLQEKFSRLWDIMPHLYHRLKEEMPHQVHPYGGAMEREVVERLHATAHKAHPSNSLEEIFGEQTFCFVGFNMLSETEQKLMSHLQKRKQALFYWDYDVMYLNNAAFEAGDFVRYNLAHFSNALNRQECFDNMQSMTSMTFVATATDSIASRYIPLWLKDHLTAEERETSIVLCDERQLLSVLHAIPDESSKESVGSPEEINVTMGYSLSGTIVYSLILSLLTLQTEGWDNKHKRFRLPFLRALKLHPYFRYIENSGWDVRVDPEDITALVNYLDRMVLSLAESLSGPALDIVTNEADVNENDSSGQKPEEEQKLNVKADDEDDEIVDNEIKGIDNVLVAESIYLAHKTLTQFLNLSLADGNTALHLLPSTTRRLLKKIMGSQSIPFNGEPAHGLQVMGLLETRCLDFKNILMLNVGEGFVPKTGADNSMIPHTLRTGFGLTTQRHRMAVFAYYFYRLLQRADHVTFVFNENSSGNVRHEMSRFLRQLQAETEIPIHNIRLEAEQMVERVALDSIEKSTDIMEFLDRKFNFASVSSQVERRTDLPNPLSPTAINRYLDCSMKFYLASVCNIIEENQPEDGVDVRMLGNIFHNTAEAIYRELLSHAADHKTVTREMLSNYTKDGGKSFQKLLDREFFKEAAVSEYRGENILIRGVLERYLLNLLRWDERHAPIVMVGMEENHFMDLSLVLEDKKKLVIKTGGRVDRIDILMDEDGKQVMRVVDYKTGAHQDSTSNMEKLFARGGHCGYYFQTFLYAIALSKTQTVSNVRIAPALFYAAHAHKPDYSPKLAIGKPGGRISSKSLYPLGPVKDIAYYSSEFLDMLEDVIAEIFDPTVPFTKTSDTKICEYCDYRKLCNR